MANIIQHKRSSTSGVVPAATGLSQGELAINIADGKLYTKNNVNSVINLGVASISGTYISPSSGNFSDYLSVNGIPVSVSGHSHMSVQQAQSLVTNVFNKTNSTIPKFSVVYIDGGQGDQPTIQLAIANGEAGSSKTYGITAEAINSMSAGSVIVAGALSGINTDQFNPTSPIGNVNGVTLYLSPSVSGAATTTKPYAPNHLVSIGTIVRTHQNAGVVEVKVQNGFELQELHNVAINGVTDGQFLQYNSGSGLWVPSSSGNFTSLSVNNTGVSLSGHNHSGVYADIATGDPTIITNSIVDNAYAIYDPANSWPGLWIIDSSVYSSDSSVFDSFKINMGLTEAVIGTGVANHIAYWNSSSGITANSGQLYWDSTNDRLGIGTANPSSKLHIITNENIPNPYTVRIENATSGAAGVQIGNASIDTNNFWQVFISNDSSPIFKIGQDNIGDYFCITEGGNVGIGTSTPSFKLDINGGIGDSTNEAINVQGLIIANGGGTTSLNVAPAETIVITADQIDLSGPSYINGPLQVYGNLTFDSFTESVVTIGNSSTSQTISLTSGTVQTCTLTGNCTFTMPTVTAGKSFTLFLNTGVGGYSATFTGVRWSDNTPPTITSTANKVDLLSFISDGTYWYGSFSQNYG